MVHAMQLYVKADTQEKILNLLNKSLPLLIGAFIFFRPIPHVTALEEIAFYSSGAIFLLLVFAKRIDFSFAGPLTLPFIVFTFWALLGLFFAVNQGNSLHDFYAHLLKYLAFFYIVVNVFNSEKRFQLLSWIIIVSAAIFSVGGIIYFYGILGNDFTSRFVNPWYLPYREFVYIFASILAFNKILETTRPSHKIILTLCLSVTVMATLLTQNRGALIALSLSSLIMVVGKRRDLVGLIVFILVPILLLSPFASRLKEISAHKNIRIGTQLLYIEVIRDHPIMGIGFGMQTYSDKRLLLEQYNSRVPDAYRQEPPIVSPHNTLVDIATRVGVVGLALFFWMIAAFLRMVCQIARHGRSFFLRDWGLCLLAAFIAFFIQAVFHDATYGAQVIVQYLILAMGTILWRLNMQRERYSGG